WTAVLIVGPVALALVVRRKSVLVTFLLIQGAAYYGFTSVVLGESRSLVLVVIVALWCVGLAIGALAGRGSRVTQHDRIWPVPSWPHIVLSAGMIAIQLSLVISEAAGYRAQLTLGLTTPVGVLGILTSAAPVVMLMLILAALG